MADHVTKQCIDAVAALILAGSTSAGSNVFTGRVTPLAEAELPGVIVHGGDEEIEPQSIHSPLLLRRQPTIDVVCLVRHTDAYDAEAYTLIKQVEHVIAAAPTLSGKCKSIYSTGVTWERSADGDRPIVRATISFLVDVTVYDNAVDVPI